MMDFRWTRLSEQDYGAFLEVIHLRNNDLTVSCGYSAVGANDKKRYKVGSYDEQDLPDSDEFMEESIEVLDDQSEDLTEFLKIEVYNE